MGKSRQPSIQGKEICRRLEEIRRLRYGERGKSRFARDLGIPITTYQHYEAGRVPSAAVLVQAARLTHVRLEWLLEGQLPRECDPERSEASGVHQDLVRRLQDILDREPALTSQVEEFLNGLETSSAAASSGSARFPTEDRSLIPLVGSTAAGVAHYWNEVDFTDEGLVADAHLEQVLQAHLSRELPPAAAPPDTADSSPVSLVQYSTPQADGFLEFLSAPALKRRYPYAVAWRIDGDSMSPRFQDGDLVVTSPKHPAVPMQPCVARQQGQIGVSCKLYRPEGDSILLIPVNQAYPVQRVPRDSIQWAWRVLSCVRLKTPD